MQNRYIIGSVVIFLWAIRLILNAQKNLIAIYYCTLSDVLVLILAILIIMEQLKKILHENYLPKIIVFGMMAIAVISPLWGVLIIQAPVEAAFEFLTLYAAFMGIAAYFFSKSS